MPFMNSKGGASGGDFRCTYRGTITTIEPLNQCRVLWRLSTELSASDWEADHG